MKEETQINEVKQRTRNRPTQIETPYYEKEKRKFSGEKIIFSINGAATTGHPFKK